MSGKLAVRRTGNATFENNCDLIYLERFSFECRKTKTRVITFGSRGGVVVRALASHQCGPGSIPGLGVMCGLSLLLVLVLAPRVFLRVLRFFLPPQKLPFLNSNSTWNSSIVLTWPSGSEDLGNHSPRFRRKIKYLFIIYLLTNVDNPMN